MEWLQICIKGQSFVLHQIRKMIGLTIAVVRGYATRSFIMKAFEKERVDVPRAPGLGLILEGLHFDWYNEKFGSTHAKVDWSGLEKAEEFRESVILQEIFKKEKEEQSMLSWVRTLPCHDFDNVVSRQRDERPRKRSTSVEKDPVGLADDDLKDEKKLKIEDPVL